MTKEITLLFFIECHDREAVLKVEMLSSWYERESLFYRANTLVMINRSSNGCWLRKNKMD